MEIDENLSQRNYDERRVCKRKRRNFLVLTAYWCLISTVLLIVLTAMSYNDQKTVSMKEENDAPKYVVLQSTLLPQATSFENLRTFKLEEKTEKLPEPAPAPEPKVVESVSEIPAPEQTGVKSIRIPSNVAIEYVPGASGQEKITKKVSDEGNEVVISREQIRTARASLVSRGGSPAKYKLSLYNFPKNFEKDKVIKTVTNVTATAYDPYDCGGNGKGVSATQIPLKKGAKAIAVDPNVVKLGSLVYVESMTEGIPDYGYAVAVDTGGDIKGKRVDLAIYDGSESPYATRFNVKIHVIDYTRIDMYNQ